MQVLIAIGLAVLLGWYSPETGIAMKPLGEGFVKLIKMLIGPIVFSTVAVGIGGMKDLKKVGRVGGKALLWFEIMTTVALVVGITMAHVVEPGHGIHADPQSLDTTELNRTIDKPRPQGTVAHLLAIIPDSFVGAFVGEDILPVLLLGVLMGMALAQLGERGQPMFHLLENFSHAIFAMVGLVMKLAPLGAFGAMAFTIGKYGVGTLGNLAKLIGTFYGTALLFVVVVLGAAVRFLLGISIFALIRALKEELVIVLGTSSSESALPRLMDKLEAMGVGKSTVRLVIPTGYSFNLDGTAIYLTLAALFVAQALDVPLTLGDELKLLAVLLLTSKGAAGVTGSGFITLAATLAATRTIPVAGLALLLGIDRFMSEARALTNFVGNAVAAMVVARWENDIDLERVRRTLANPAPPPVDEAQA